MNQQDPVDESGVLIGILMLIAGLAAVVMLAVVLGIVTLIYVSLA
jgi:uncharacterized membrane-anchored protein